MSTPETTVNVQLSPGDILADRIWWDRERCAAEFGVAKNTFTREIATRPGFPKASRFSSRVVLYKRTEIAQYIEDNRR